MRNAVVVIGAALVMTVVQSTSAAALAQQPDAPYSVDHLHLRIDVQSDGSAEIERHQSLTVFWSSAVDSLSQLRQSYSSSRETLEILTAWTLRPDGQRIDVMPAGIREVDEYGGQASIYSDQKAKVVIFPNVEVGSRLHRHSRTTVFRPLYPGQFMFSEVFHPNIIYRDVTIDLSYPEDLTLYVDARGMQSLPEPHGGAQPASQSGRHPRVTQRYRYQQETPKGYEADSVDWADLVPHFQISTIASAQALAAQYASAAKSREAVTPEIAHLAKTITEGMDDPLEQVKAIYAWVAREIRYVGIYLVDTSVVPNYASDVLMNRYGDCKDHNTLLVSLLKAKGIDAQAALVNMGDAYELPAIGVLATLNHVITYLPQWDLFLDSTNGLTPFGLLDPSVMDKPAVLTRDARVVRTPRSSLENNSVSSRIQIKVTPEGVIEGQSESQLQGTFSLAVRRYLSNYEGDNRQEMVRQQLANFLHTGDGEFAFHGVWERIDPMQFSMRFALDPMTNFPGPGALSLPGGLAPGSLAGIAAETSLAPRSLPFPCRSIRIEENYEIELPSSAKVTRIPDDVTYMDGDVQYRAHYRRKGRVVQASRELVLDRPSHVCPASAIDKIGRLANVMRRDLRSQIFYQ